ncbi:MAG: polyhydroxyalkanoate depolymerase [Pseudomonadota bacterium]
MILKPSLAYDIAHLSSFNLKRSANLASEFWSHPFMKTIAPHTSSLFEAAGLLVERSVSAAQSKPEWDINSVQINGRRRKVSQQIVEERPFGDLLHFDKGTASKGQPRILIVAPKSGHYATLLRDTVTRLLPEADVYVTDWRNARDVPLEAGKFDIEDYVEYLLHWFDLLGPTTHVVGVCQPAPLALAAVARYEQLHQDRPIASLSIMGGPIDPAKAPTEVTKYADQISMDTLKQNAVHRVGFAYDGRGRDVYPGAMQLSAFVSMNAKRHLENFQNQWFDLARGRVEKVDRHNSFYDEYLAVMDMTAEFYLSTVERVFKNREVGRDVFHLRGEHVPISGIKKTPIFVIEGERDDVAAPGQCKAALEITTSLPKARKQYHLEPDAGHYAVFSGTKWRENIAPKVLAFMAKSEKLGRSKALAKAA